jgi:putative ABC transport system permease protein
MLARGAERQQEFAIRRALGASRWRLVRELSVESAIVAILGGVLAFVVIQVLLVLTTVDLPLPKGSFSLEPALNPGALLVASVAVLLSLAVFGLEPALQLTRPTVNADLAGGTATIGLPRSGRQRAFIRWQVAISASFFLVAAILAKVVVVEARHDPGVDVDRLAIATVHFSLLGWDEARARRVLGAAVDSLRQERSIERVAVSSGVPFGMMLTPYSMVTTPDRPFVRGRTDHDAFFITATPDIFRTLGVPILRGRGLTERDDAGAPAVSVVSEATARALFGTSQAIGRQVVVNVWGRPPSRTFTVVGIARDTDSQTLISRTSGTLYVPLAQHYEPNLTVVVRTSGNTTAVARVVQSALRRADLDLGTGAAGPGWILLTGAYLAARIAAALAAALGMLTLILAMVGLYGVQSHIVARRTREVGVRMALGASAPQIERMVLGEGFRPVVEGLVLGAVLGVILRLGARALVHASIQPFDVAAFAVVPIPLFIAAFVACYVPARRAARVDPNTALRHL